MTKYDVHWLTAWVGYNSKGCILSVGAIVDHDVVIEDFVHVNAGTICKGGSKVESGRKLEAGEVVRGY